MSTPNGQKSTDVWSAEVVTGGDDVDAVTEATRSTQTQGRPLLTVSAAARMLGVSSSSLRAWAAAGRVPHVRTRGGHRRFDHDELEGWLAERGGEPPSPPSRSTELVPTRLEPQPAAATMLLSHLDDIVTALEAEVRRSGVRTRSTAARRSRATDAIEALSDGVARGDLGPCYRESEWEGFRHGASGQAGDGPIAEALALRRAVDRALPDELPGEPESRRALRRGLDRMAIRVAAGYAEGVKSRNEAHGN